MPGASPISANHRQPTMMEVQVEGTTLREEDYDPADWTKIIGTYQGKSQSKARMEYTNGVRGKQKASEERTETLPALTWRPTYRPNPAHLRATQQVKRKSRQMAPLPQHAIKVVFRSQGGLFLPNIQPQLLLRCLCETAKIPMGAEVQLRVHPMNNTCTVATTNQEAALNLVKIRSITLNAKADPFPVESSTMGEYTCARHIGRDQRPARTVAPQDTDMMCVQNRKYRDVQDAAKITAKTEHGNNRKTPATPRRFSKMEYISPPEGPRGAHMGITNRPQTRSPGRGDDPSSRGGKKLATGHHPTPPITRHPNHHPTLTPTHWSPFTPRHPEFISRRNLNFHPIYKKEKKRHKRLQTLEAGFPTLEARIDSLIDERFKILENKLDTFCTQLRTLMGLMVAEATNQMQVVPLPHTTHPPSTSQTSGQQNGR
ncbi:hypothetical protein HPB49_007262 [Dermacentor silvarum]|uniref:Uncharacterized protein n=1 Tax=Dermacentor silvarum TaxID=543639 RepID=A0ACB8CK12_DERSI|nr:hypothetical protein HPB49_007262 [Dermacentor silvarum]